MYDYFSSSISIGLLQIRFSTMYFDSTGGAATLFSNYAAAALKQCSYLGGVWAFWAHLFLLILIITIPLSNRGCGMQRWYSTIRYPVSNNQYKYETTNITLNLPINFKTTWTWRFWSKPYKVRVNPS